MLKWIHKGHRRSKLVGFLFLQINHLRPPLAAKDWGRLMADVFG